MQSYDQTRCVLETRASTCAAELGSGRVDPQSLTVPVKAWPGSSRFAPFPLCTGSADTDFSQPTPTVLASICSKSPIGA